MFGVGTVAVMDKAAELAAEERAEKAKETDYSYDPDYERSDRIGSPAARPARSDEISDSSYDYGNDD